MPSKHVFCNEPWYEVNIFQDGSFGYCCHQVSSKCTPDIPLGHNIKNMSIKEWHTSDYMNTVRLKMHSSVRLPECEVCWHQERYSTSSRRYNSNIKSVIFTKQNFNESYRQSPNYTTFDYSLNNVGKTIRMPVDLHINLGNYCNLSCKMCNPESSSSIAFQYKKWGMLDKIKSLRYDWTADRMVWDNFISQILQLPDLMNIHFVGGETLISRRFEELVDIFIANKRFDLCFSFVTNGMFYNKELMKKLALFKRVGIDISIETLTKHNEYIRQGTNTSTVIGNIARYRSLAENKKNVEIMIRPALSILSIGTYHTLLSYCLKNNILIKANNVINPECLATDLIPLSVREQYKIDYVKLLSGIDISKNPRDDNNDSNASNYELVIQSEINKCLKLLSNTNVNEQQYDEFIRLISKWDKVYNYNAYEYYPEFALIFDKYEYGASRN